MSRARPKSQILTSLPSQMSIVLAARSRWTHWGQRGWELRPGQLWGKALQVKGFDENTWLVRYEGPPGVGAWPSSATRGTLYVVTYLEDSGWSGDPLPRTPLCSL